MLLKPGVDISRLRREVRRSLPKVDRIYAGLGEEMVVTSTYSGNHFAGSLHYADLAYDVRLPKIEQKNTIMEIRKYLAPDFDVIGEIDHIHVEYDPKK